VKISTEIGSLAKLVGEERAIELVARAGFDAWDFSMFAMAKLEKGTSHVMDSDHPLHGANYADYAKRLGRIASDCGIVCNQSHAPFPTRGKEVLYYIKRAIECTAIVGGDVCVVHPDTTKTVEENTELYAELLEFAKGYGVRIATENMWDWNRELDQASRTACSHHDDFKAQLRAVNDPTFVACLDIGHAAMKGLDTSVGEMILTLGDDLAALHVHDNDGWHDLHALPGSGCIDFDEMLSCLHRINYRGYLTLEANRHAHGFTAETASDCAKELAAAARRLANRYESL
jgi:sugar phosphate isomerase/epimerase